MGKKVKKEVETPTKDAFDPLNIESKKTATVVLMLSSEEEEVLSKACEAIYKFADKCDENKITLLELGAINPILKLIKHEDKVVRRYAVMCFGVIAGHVEVRKQLRETEAIESAVQLLGDEDDVCNEFASLFLAHMSSEFLGKIKINQFNGIEPLVSLLESPDPDTQKNCVQAICNLTEDFQIRSSVRELGGLAPLLELLKSEYAIIQELTLSTLSSVTQDVETRVTFRENEGLEHLMTFLNNKEFEDLHVNALRVLSSCLEDTEALNEFQSTGGLERLLTFSTESTSPEVQTYSCHAIARAANKEENAKILHEHGVEATLITLSGSDNDEVRVAACHAISAMSKNSPSKDTFGSSEGILPLVNLLQVESGNVKEASSLALANLTLNHKNNCNEVIANGGIEQMIPLLTFNKEAVVVNILTCLINMSHDEQTRTDIIKRELIPALIQPLKSESVKINSRACKAVASFVTTAESRADLCKNEGLEPLVQHLRTCDAQLRKDASWAILTCCVDGPTATAFTKLGALETLQQMNGSEQRKNSFSLAAFEKLLDSNLSAKLSFTGSLSQNDIITDGFYDAGKLSPNSQFVSLEDLAKQDVDQKRPVIIVNCKAPDISKAVQDETSEKGPGGKSTMTRRARKKDKGAQLKETEKSATTIEDDAYKPIVDVNLQNYLDEVSKFILPMPTLREQVVALAQYVVEKMGGEVEKDKMMEFSWELHIAELKFDLKSNVIPIGKIKRGIYHHRALLFKTLADRISLPCTLVKGDYNRAWNEVLVSSEEKGTNYPPFKYVVDLMHESGRLIRADSPAAVLYQTI